MSRLLIAGNSTMPSSVGIFNLPPLVTCKPSRWCRKYCYGLQGRFLWNPVRKSLMWRLGESLRPDFVDNLIDELECRNFEYVRIHITGDFYSQEYINKWAVVAKLFPSIIFRTNTKRYDYLKYMKKVFPENIVVRESTDVTRKSHGIYPQVSIQGTKGSSKFFACQNNCSDCEFYCWHNPKINVVLGIL